MRFVSGARAKDITYTIVPANRVKDEDGFVQRTTPIRAVFKNHEFDSVAAQQANGWSDRVRMKVEQYLLRHKTFGQVDGHGIWTDDTPADAKTLADIGPMVGDQVCEFIDITDGKPASCSKFAAEGERYCDEHMARFTEESTVVAEEPAGVS